MALIPHKLQEKWKLGEILCNRYGETGTVHDRPGRGRKRILSTKEEKKVVKKARKIGATQTARQFSANNNKKISRQTVGRVMKKYYFFYLKRKKGRGY